MTAWGKHSFTTSIKKDESDTAIQKIPFFAEKGDIKINTRLNTFLSSAKVEGQKIKYFGMIFDGYEKFNNQNIELVKII